MGKIRRNALNYSVKYYAEILLENLDTISDTKEKFQKYRELLRTLNKIVRMESFQDDFYRKPLEHRAGFGEGPRLRSNESPSGVFKWQRGLRQQMEGLCPDKRLPQQG